MDILVADSKKECDIDLGYMEWKAKEEMVT
jgi:hypothetical protein